MYLPEKFKESRPEVLHALMRTNPLATLVVAGTTGLLANHIPIEPLEEPKPFGKLRGHIARANPMWREYSGVSEALAIFQGPSAYISPNFYPTKQQTGEVVPTWNYAIVHVRGALEFTHDAEWLRQLVVGLTSTHEASQSLPWKVDDAPRAYIDGMLKLIVGFELTITSMVGKFKLSQNRTDEDRRGVLAGLRSASDASALQMADMLGLE